MEAHLEVQQLGNGKRSSFNNKVLLMSKGTLKKRVLFQGILNKKIKFPKINIMGAYYRL
jgi:hypothetical protein